MEIEHSFDFHFFDFRFSTLAQNWKLKIENMGLPPVSSMTIRTDPLSMPLVDSREFTCVCLKLQCFPALLRKRSKSSQLAAFCPPWRSQKRRLLLSSTKCIALRHAQTPAMAITTQRASFRTGIKKRGGARWKSSSTGMPWSPTASGELAPKKKLYCQTTTPWSRNVSRSRPLGVDGNRSESSR